MDYSNPAAKRSEVPVVCPSDDALVYILSRVPAKSRFRFKCVSKPWRDLLTDRLRCRKFPQTLEGFFLGGSSGDKDNFGNFIDISGRPSPLVDASFSFLTELPEIQKINLLGSCNGLVLFGHRRDSDNYDSLGYVVCNPATQQWVAVPSCGWTPPPLSYLYACYQYTCTYLIFDPAASPHFQLVQFTQDEEGVVLQFRENNDDDEAVTEVRTYSSESGVWSNQTSEWGAHGCIMSSFGSAFVNGMLHFMVGGEYGKEDQIVVVDREGNKCRNIRWAKERGEILFVGQSQGRLHCISGLANGIGETPEVSVWVLEDYDGEEWVWKHSVSFAHLSGNLNGEDVLNFYFVSIHPECNMVFFVRSDSQKLISYHMDTKEMCVLCSVRRDYEHVTQYVPYFSVSSALANRH
ncbi:hypothetical protein HU200_014364 [Digitaria exilis]|uniref:F-box domain-containing protein n=1 Tax=Digitaria exilis TaxID=1010633 RepID=A0A835FBQ9_9POAL|nr:hypothetical protein HU200_014364 [Digitaria exilis]